LASDQGRRFVYVIDAENKVAARPVEVGVLVDGRRAITRGLAAGERVVVTGLQRLRKNMVVEPRPQTPEVAAK
jgi:membrane fusion protein, multidrug efflux system